MRDAKLDGAFEKWRSFKSLQIFDIHILVNEWGNFKSDRTSAISIDVN